MKKPIPVKISERRRALGLTQEKLGALLGVSPQAVSKWENAECLPDLTLIPPLCQALHISADELLEVPPVTRPKGAAKLSASELRIHSRQGLSLSVVGEEAMRAIQAADVAAMGDLTALLSDADALCVLRALSFTAIGFEEEIAQTCHLSAEAVRNALFRLLRMEICQCAPEGYVLGSNAYLAYALLSAAWLASPAGRADVGEITVSYTT